MTTSAPALAIDGGTPVRDRPYPRTRGAELIGAEEQEAVRKVIEARALFRYGPTALGTVDAAEAALRDAFAAPYAVAVSSGTAALHVGLLALGVREGDEVIVPAATFVATVNAVVAARAVPVFAEVDDSLTLDPAHVETLMSPRTRVIVPVHLDNVAADLDPLAELARRHGVHLLEDAAQAAGVTYRGRPIGSTGTTALSFQQGKNITCGEGGALLTDDFTVYDRALRFHDQGGQFTTFTGQREHSSGPPLLGTNLRMNELSGAVLGTQVSRLPGLVADCRRIARAIRADLADLDLAWRRQPDPDGDGGSLIFFAADATEARWYAAALTAEGIPSGRMYDGDAVYLNPALRAGATIWADGCPFHCDRHPVRQHYAPGLCPRSEDLFSRAVVIAVSPVMTARDCTDVVTAMRKVTRRRPGGKR